MAEPALSDSRQVVKVLGGKRVLRLLPESLEELQERIRSGLPYSALKSLMARYDLTREEACRALDLSPRTFSRRKGQRQLRPDESDRLYRLARIAALASDVLGADARASTWLRRPNRALAGQTPLSLLSTDLGTRQVEEVLGRMLHGVVS